MALNNAAAIKAAIWKMNIMKNKITSGQKTSHPQCSVKKFLFVVLLAVTSGHSASFAQQSIDDYSVLPENLTGDLFANPNILILLDTSSSMLKFNTPNKPFGDYITDPVTKVQYLKNETHRDASSSFSNSYQVRKAIRAVLSSEAYQGRLNVGLMGFGQNSCTYDKDVNEATKNKLYDNNVDAVCKVYGINKYNTIGTNGLGLLRANIAPLEGDHAAKLSKLLSSEPSHWNDGKRGTPYPTKGNIGSRDGDAYVKFGTDVSYPIHGVGHPYLVGNADGDLVIDGSEEIMMSEPSGFNFTPIGGALETAFRYLFKNDTKAQAAIAAETAGGNNLRRLSFDLHERELNLGSEELQHLSASQCQGPLTVILLTDGIPSQSRPPNTFERNGGIDIKGPKPQNQAEAAAEWVRYRGRIKETDRNAMSDDDQVKVHVIGFKIGAPARANKIAKKGGTGKTILTTSTAEVEQAFKTIFNAVLKKGASRSGISVIAAPDSATGSFVQPSFTPLIEERLTARATEKVVWSGEVRNFFIDRFGNFREDTSGQDSDGNSKLDTADKGFRILFDKDTNQSYVERFDVDVKGRKTNFTGRPDGKGNFEGGHIAVNDLKPIWSARDQLNRLADDEFSVRWNRGYNEAITSKNHGRWIFTSFDIEPDSKGKFSSSDMKIFVWVTSDDAARINPNNMGVLDLPAGADSTKNAKDLIFFIRGYQNPDENNFRNRIINGYKYQLGDIVHSSPVQVDGPVPLEFPSNPLKTDDLRDTYEPYAIHYKNRRKMVYVGANDGMLHAFNGGFWEIDSSTGAIEVKRQLDSKANHELGDEVWAFIPNAVLPHLKFLQDPNYDANQHIAFVDGSLEAFEVKIFDTASGNCVVATGSAAASNCRYVNGWGTILVGGLRYGGADYTADFDADGSVEAHETTRSSYFILDITDPEREPVLLDEITSPDLKLTVSKPALVRGPGSSTTDREYRLIFGSGPNDAESATNTSGTPASLFIYDLKERDGLTKVALPDASTTSFVGDMTAVDWNADDIDDAIYFGTVAGTVAVPTGKLFRSTLTISGASDSLTSNVLLDVGKAIQHRPVIPADHATRDDKYILFGTGRTLSLEDSNFNYSPVNQLYGIKESISGSILDNPIVFGPSPVVTSGQLLNTTAQDPTASDENDEIINANTRTEILAEIEDETTAPVYRGWFFDLPESTSRLSARPANIAELMFFTDYQPQDPATLTVDQCLPEGAGFLTVLDYRTGLFPAAKRLTAEQSANTGESSTNFLNFRVSSSLLGEGDILIIGDPEDGSIDFKFLAPGSNQEVSEFKGSLEPASIQPVEAGRKSWREINLDFFTVP